MKTSIRFLFLLIVTTWLTRCSEPETAKDYPIKPVPYTAVQMTDDFWQPRIRKNHEVTIPIALYQSEITGRIKNFQVAGGLVPGTFSSEKRYDDSDVYKIIEGASYSLQTFPDPELEARIDTIISYIAAAQEDDGYLFTNRTILGDSVFPLVGPERWIWVHKHSHELYNLGHLFEAAVAHHQATGKESLLNVALKAAGLVDQDFGWDKIEKYPGHQEIEIGLVKLYRLTGKKKYLDLAKFFLDVRGPDGEEYNQARKKVTEQSEAVGHAVRAMYMYSAMADVAALTGDISYTRAIQKIWKDIVHHKMYVTGGIGSSGGNEGFGEAYHLPNKTAYCETCASIANIFWNHRMFLHHGKAKYYDILERSLYNSLLSGISLSGNRFFYPNPLTSEGRYERSEWFDCACCPSNLTRFIPSLPGYFYAHTDDQIYVNLYASNKAKINLAGKDVEVIQEARYPWDGTIGLEINPEEEARFGVKLRLPGWSRNDAVPGDLYYFSDSIEKKYKLVVNDEEADAPLEDGYLVLDRKWHPGDRIRLDLKMPLQKILAHPEVEADRGKIAIQSGPLVFAIEWVDQEDQKALNKTLTPGMEFQKYYEASLLDGTSLIKANGITLIPYHLWANRGPGEMTVWIPWKED